MRSSTQLLAVLVASTSFLLPAVAVLTVSEPSSAHWWVAGSINTLAWSGSDPTEFTVLLANPDVNVLTDRFALESIVPTYIYSKSINPGNVKAATGYTLQLANPLNSSDIYATSDTFEIKPLGSTYPSQITPAASTPGAAVSGSSSNANVNATATASSHSSAIKNGVTSNMMVTLGSGLVGGVIAFEWLMGMLSGETHRLL